MDRDPVMRITYWGVRGSIPSPLTTAQIQEKETALLKRIIADGGLEKLFGANPQPEVIRAYLETLPFSLSGTYGGDTTCVEIQTKDSPLIIIDAGTGARALGQTLLGRLFSGNNLNPLNHNAETARDIHLFFSHYHWDHVQGIPFFGPAFIAGEKQVRMNFYGKADARQRLSDVLKGQQEYPSFPVVWEDMPCGKEYHELSRMTPAEIHLGESTVRNQELTHPDSVFAYAITVGDRKFVFATDTEHKDRPDPRLVQLARDADILYYDSQYTSEEYDGDPKSVAGLPAKIDWGHSTYEWAVRNALAANVHTVVLGHHEPRRDDFKLEELLGRAIAFRDAQLQLPAHTGKQLQVVLAYQGMTQTL